MKAYLYRTDYENGYEAFLNGALYELPLLSKALASGNTELAIDVSKDIHAALYGMGIESNGYELALNSVAP